MYNFVSPTSGKECTAAQYLAELMVTREAAKQKIKLAVGFWNSPLWKKKYKQQIIAANSLLKIYSPQAIINALKRKECSWQYSLRANGINDACNEEQIKLDQITETMLESERKFDNITTSEVKKFGKESKLNKLRD